MNIETRLLKLEKSTSRVNLFSNLTDSELQSELFRIANRLKTLMEAEDCDENEILEINKVLHRAQLN